MFFSTIGSPLHQDPINHNPNDIYNQSETTSHFSFPHQFSSPHPQLQLHSSTPSMVKKLNHNASERDRRKKINTLYSSLRSLLPVAHQMKKVSIPATISLVLKYIPELQQQVEGLIKKKEKLLLRISQQVGAANNKESQRRMGHHNSVCVVSTNGLSDSEAVVQISTYKVHKIPLSEILQCLEKDNLLLLNASSFETFGGRVFHNLHFQVEKSFRLESEILSEKLLSIYEKEDVY